MEILKKYNVDIILLVIIAGVLLLGNIIVAVPRELRDINRHGLLTPSQQYNRNRIRAKQIQNALAEYYANYDDFPDEKEFNKAMLKEIGKIPTYDDNKKMVRKYKKVVNANRKYNSYKVYFYDNSCTTIVNERNFILTDGTDTNHLFRLEE